MWSVVRIGVPPTGTYATVRRYCSSPRAQHYRLGMDGGDSQRGDVASQEPILTDEGTDTEWLAFNEASVTAPDLAAISGRGPLRRAARWLGLLTLAAFTTLAVLVAVGTMQAMRNHDDCPLPALQFEVIESETVAVSWLPPKVQCHYFVATSPERAERQQGGLGVSDDVTWESRWRVLLPVPFALIWLAIILARRRPKAVA